MKSACLGAGEVGGKGDGHEATKQGVGICDQIGSIKSELRCLFGAAEFVCLPVIGNSSPLSSSSSSSNLRTVFRPVSRSSPPRFSLHGLDRLPQLAIGFIHTLTTNLFISVSEAGL